MTDAARAILARFLQVCGTVQLPCMWNTALRVQPTFPTYHLILPWKKASSLQPFLSCLSSFCGLPAPAIVDAWRLVICTAICLMSIGILWEDFVVDQGKGISCSWESSIYQNSLGLTFTRKTFSVFGLGCFSFHLMKGIQDIHISMKNVAHCYFLPSKCYQTLLVVVILSPLEAAPSFEEMALRHNSELRTISSW